MKVSPWAVPALVVTVAGLGVAGARLFALPSFERSYPGAAEDGPRREVTFVVDGLRCVDTARRVAAQLEVVPGVAEFTGFATRHEARVTFDPSRTDVQTLRRVIEGPEWEPSTGRFLFHRFRVVGIDGPAE